MNITLAPDIFKGMSQLMKNKNELKTSWIFENALEDWKGKTEIKWIGCARGEDQENMENSVLISDNIHRFL